jgi:ribonuclease HI
MLIISIDGACRRNGKPDCVASGGVFIEQYSGDGDEKTLVGTKILSNYEIQSTNQRGELLALITALDYVWSAKQPTQIITDSEYIFNAMTKEWFIGWESREWMTASYEPVKNSDLWREIKHSYDMCILADIDITFYHIKGHCIPFGKVTANTLLKKDDTGQLLLKEVYKKYDLSRETKQDKLQEANELSWKNNGFYMPHEIQRHFVVINVMADAIATKCVDAADALMA